jgi:hypothetical protein
MALGPESAGEDDRRRTRPAHLVDLPIRCSLPQTAEPVHPSCYAIQLHHDEITTKVAPGAHAILILDQAGWHGAKQLRIPITSPVARARSNPILVVSGT